MTRRIDVHKTSLKAMRYDSLEHWLEDPQHVYVAGARKHDFANRLGVEKYGRDECLRRYEAWLIEILQNDEVRTRFGTLRNKTLGCWCRSDDRCHVDVIIRMLSEADVNSVV